MISATLIWDTAVSLPLNSPNNDGPEGIEIYKNFLYATDFVGSNIDVYKIDAQSGALRYSSSFGSTGSGIGNFGPDSPVDMSFFTLSNGQTKAYVPAAINQRIVVLDVDPQTGALSWDVANSQANGQVELSTPYGIEINGNFLYATDYGGSNIDIYEINRETGGLTFISSFGSQGRGVDQFSSGSPVDMSFFELVGGATKAYVPDAENQRIVVLDVDTQTGALSWDEALTLPNGLPESTLQYGLEIDENQLYVTDWGGHNIDIYNIDPQTGALTYTHSVGSEGTGTGQFITPVDLSFYKTEDGITRAYVPDSGNKRIAALQVADAAIADAAEGLLSVVGAGQSQLTLTLVTSDLAAVSEIVVISTDSPDGLIGDVGPDSANYLLAAQPNAEVIFSVLDRASTPPGFSLERTITVEGGRYLNFVLIQGGSLQDAIDRPDQVKVSMGAQILTQGNTLGNTGASANGALAQNALADAFVAQIGLGAGHEKSASGVGRVVLTVRLADRDRPIGSSKQTGNAGSNLIDLTEEVGVLTAEFEVYREASFNSAVGFFKVVDTQGSVLTDRDALLAPGDEGYAAAALKHRLDMSLSSSNKTTSRYQFEIEGGQMLSAFIVVDGTIEEYLAAAATADTSDDLHIFFTHMGANADSGDHVKLLGDNTFGFEDTMGGGDGDFDDIIVKAIFS